MHPPVDPHDLDRDLPRAADILRSAERVTILTGAGVSAESGVPTFRGADGLWEGSRVEEVATPRAFERDPALVWRFYNLRRENLRRVEPNPGHQAIVAMEQRWGDRFVLVTQNVDGLHGQAGSHRVLELHGNLHRTRCTRCGMIEDRGLEPLGDMPSCSDSACDGLLRPDIVWFEEMLPEGVLDSARLAVVGCNCLLVVGTSAMVYPAAGLIPLAQHVGAAVIEVNLTPTAATDQADIGLYGPSGEVLPRLLGLLDRS